MNDISDAWKLCDQLSVVQAALLISGCDPMDHLGSSSEELKRCVPHFLAVETALLSAIGDREDFGQLDYDYNGNDFERGSINPFSSTVRVVALKEFLSEKGVRDGFFFPDESKPADYLDPSHPRYAPKLAAAVRAWEALDDASKLAGKSPKKALEKWLRENAADFDLTSEEDGTVNETAIEAIARISNWRPQGGAPSTPTEAANDLADAPKQPVLRIAPPSFAEPEPIDSIDECPF